MDDCLAAKVASIEEQQVFSVHERSNFALGSLFYLINYGFEVYGDQCFGSDPSGKEHGPMVMDLLQNMIFPELNGEPEIDCMIKKCWNGGYGTVAALAADTERLCCTGSDASKDKGKGSQYCTLVSVDDFALRRKECEGIVESGILKALSLRNPRQTGLPMKRRHICLDLLQG
jgi:hypothetical protein